MKNTNDLSKEQLLSRILCCRIELGAGDEYYDLYTCIEQSIPLTPAYQQMLYNL